MGVNEEKVEVDVSSKGRADRIVAVLVSAPDPMDATPDVRATRPIGKLGSLSQH